MSDEQENVDVVPEEETVDTVTPVEPTVDETSDTFDETDETVETEPAEIVDGNGSRTGFVQTGRPGDTCVCPDGRTGTVHRFDEGLICIPNADQG